MSDNPVVPLRRVYPFNFPGQSIVLYGGTARVGRVSLAEVGVELAMRRGLKIRWHTNRPDERLELGRADLGFDHPELGAVKIPVDVLNSDGWGVCPGGSMGNGECLRRVVVHWVNLPSIWPADVLSLDNRSWIGRWSVQASGWTHTLDSRADHTKVVSQATRDDAPYVVTHVAELTRTDGDAFTGSQAIDVLFAWQLALSFALGRFVAPALPVGFDDQNRRVWEHWAPWRCDTLTGYQAWWDNHTADDLAGFVDNYIAAYLNPKGHDLVRWMVMHLITANHAGTTGEGKVMLAQAGLGYFAWVTLVLSGTMSRTEYEKLNAAERLRHVLERAGLPPGVPDDLDALYQLAHERTLDGPGAAVWVRNRLTHPKDAGEPYRLEGLVWQAAQLLLEYGELLLLHHLEYSGPFMRRYPPGRWSHTNELVPWARGRT